jgi:hypothetical protein
LPSATALPGQGAAGGKGWWFGVDGHWNQIPGFQSLCSHWLVCVTLGKLPYLKSYFPLYSGADNSLYSTGLLGQLNSQSK